MLLAFLGAMLVAAAAPPAPTVDPVPFGLFSAGDMSWTLGASFSPDGRTVYFTKSEQSLAGMTIFRSQLASGRWSTPDVAPFSGQYADSDAAVTPDGSAVVFSSHRPPLGSPTTAGLYEAVVAGPAAGKVVPLPNSANTLGSETSPSIAQDGTVYFTLNVRGVRRLYRVPSISEQPVTAAPLDLPGDVSGVVDRDVTVDPAQRFVIFSSIRPGALGSFDLYIAFHAGDHYCAPLALPVPVNSPSSEIAPSLSRDGSTLYFSSNRNDLVQPTLTPLDAAGFSAALGRYEDGSIRVYAASIGPWIKRLVGSVAC